MRVRVFLPFLTMCFTLVSVGAFASPVSYTFIGTQEPLKPTPGNAGPSNFLGTNCDPTDIINPDCILGNQPIVAFQPFSATLSGDTSTQQWTLTIHTNAPLNYQDNARTIPNFAFGDALFKYGKAPNGIDDLYWGLAIGSSQAGGAVGLPNPGTTAGGLYESKLNGTSTAVNYPNMYYVAGGGNGSTQLGLGLQGGRASEPVWINTTNSVTGTTVMTEVDTARSLNIHTDACPAGTPPDCGSKYALYTITDTFTGPAGFLSSGIFGFEFSSFICANGLIIAATPEPRAVSLFVLGILLLVYGFARLRKAQVS